MNAKLCDRVAKRLESCQMPPEIWWKVPPEVRRRFYHGKTFILVRRFPDGRRAAAFHQGPIPECIINLGKQ